MRTESKVAYMLIMDLLPLSVQNNWVNKKVGLIKCNEIYLYPPEGIEDANSNNDEPALEDSKPEDAGTREKDFDRNVKTICSKALKTNHSLCETQTGIKTKLIKNNNTKTHINQSVIQSPKKTFEKKEQGTDRQMEQCISEQNIMEDLGAFKVVQYQRDLSVNHMTAQAAYYASEMNVRRRQLVCDVNLSNITVQAGAMQWMVGDVKATKGLKGVGDFIGKTLRGKVTKESAIKPEYTGTGKLVLEPTYKHMLLIDVDDWNRSIVLEDGLFLAYDSELKHKAIMRSNLSSAALGGEGLSP